MLEELFSLFWALQTAAQNFRAQPFLSLEFLSERMGTNLLYKCFQCITSKKNDQNIRPKISCLVICYLLLIWLSCCIFKSSYTNTLLIILLNILTNLNTFVFCSFALCPLDLIICKYRNLEMFIVFEAREKHHNKRL